MLATSILVALRRGADRGALLLQPARRAPRGGAGGVRRRRTATPPRSARASIETELEQVRKRLADVEPAEHAQAEEIRELAREREQLQAKLAELAQPRGGAARSTSRFVELEEERRALEDLLGEAVEDLGQKESVIQGLQDRLKRATRRAKPRRRPAAGSAAGTSSSGACAPSIRTSRSMTARSTT